MPQPSENSSIGNILYSNVLVIKYRVNQLWNCIHLKMSVEVRSHVTGLHHIDHLALFTLMLGCSCSLSTSKYLSFFQDALFFLKDFFSNLASSVNPYLPVDPAAEGEPHVVLPHVKIQSKPFVLAHIISTFYTDFRFQWRQTPHRSYLKKQTQRLVWGLISQRLWKQPTVSRVPPLPVPPPLNNQSISGMKLELK